MKKCFLLTTLAAGLLIASSAYASSDLGTKSGLNPIKEKLSQQQAVYGGTVVTPSPDNLEAFASTGKLDFIWIDAEKTAITLSQLPPMIMAAENNHVIPIIRSPDDNPSELKKYIGLAENIGIMIPDIKTAEQAQKIIETVKYRPLGKRSTGPNRANRYLNNLEEHLKTANQQTLVILMIETKEAVENIDKIAKVPGIDAWFIGHYDLSLSLETTPRSKEEKAAVAKVEATAKKYGIPLGDFVTNIEQAEKMQEQGYYFFALPYDTKLLENSVNSFFENETLPGY